MSAGLADQAISSASNFLLLIVVARASTATQFGAFATAQAVFLFVLGTTQAIVSESFIIRTNQESADAREASVAAVGMAFLIGIGQLFIVVPLALCLSGTVGKLLLIFSLATPFLLVQDTIRFIASGLGRPSAALRNDTLWLALVVPLLGYSAIMGLGPQTQLLMWASSGALCGLIFCWTEKIYPSLKGGLPWALKHRDLTLRFAAEFGITSGSSQIAAIMLAGVLGLPGLAALRANQLLYGPLNVLVNGTRIAALPPLVALSPIERLRAWKRYRMALLIVTALYAAIVMAMPEILGKLLLGETWYAASDLRGLFAVQYILLVLSTMYVTWLRAIPAPKSSLIVRCFFGLATLTIPILCGSKWGVVGAAWGLSGALAVAVCAGSYFTTRHIKSVR